MSALLVLVLLAQTQGNPILAPPVTNLPTPRAVPVDRESSAGGIAIDVAGHVISVVGTGAVTTGVLVGTRRASAGLAVTELAFANVFGLPLAAMMLASNPITVIGSDVETDGPGQKAFLLGFGLALDVATPALVALGAWTAERLPFPNETRGAYGHALLGAAIGTVLALTVDALISRWFEPSDDTFFWANWRVGLATGLISAGATTGLRLSH